EAVVRIRKHESAVRSSSRRYEAARGAGRLLDSWRALRVGRAGLLALACALATALLAVGASTAPALTVSEASFVEKAQTKPALDVAGETLTWQAVDATHSYVLQRTIPG